VFVFVVCIGLLVYWCWMAKNVYIPYLRSLLIAGRFNCGTGLVLTMKDAECFSIPGLFPWIVEYAPIIYIYITRLHRRHCDAHVSFLVPSFEMAYVSYMYRICIVYVHCMNTSTRVCRAG